jgi:hypothetical protein
MPPAFNFKPRRRRLRPTPRGGLRGAQLPSLGQLLEQRTHPQVGHARHAPVRAVARAAGRRRRVRVRPPRPPRDLSRLEDVAPDAAYERFHHRALQLSNLGSIGGGGDHPLVNPRVVAADGTTAAAAATATTGLRYTSRIPPGARRSSCGERRALLDLVAAWCFERAFCP